MLPAMTNEKRHRYAAVPTSEPASSSSPGEAAASPPRRKGRKLVIIAVLVLVNVAAFLYNYFVHVYPHPSHACEETASCANTSPESWGQYSPFFWVESDINPGTPEGCSVNFLQILSRHGSRGPTMGKLIMYAAVLARLQSNVTNYAKGFEFIKNYELGLEPDQLTWFGEQEMADLGEGLLNWYSELARGAEPFVRASGSERVIASAHNFTQGFYAAQGRRGSDYENDILVIPEQSGYNNTLDHGGCAYFEDGPGKARGVAKQREWQEKWVPAIQKRLNKKLRNANLSLDETIYMMELCPFISVASQPAQLSKFCGLFTESEWENYDYYQSLEKWYVYGPGRKLGPTQGVGYVNELIARLTGEAVDDHTSTNSTLDSSPKTYPLDRKIYADFSHDNTMLSIYAAMGLFNGTEGLPLDRRVPPQELSGYSASWAVPFGARMYVEKMACAHSEEELVRVNLNGRVVPLQGCDADELGRCTLRSFIESQSFAREGGRWFECEAEWDEE